MDRPWPCSLPESSLEGGRGLFLVQRALPGHHIQAYAAGDRRKEVGICILVESAARQVSECAAAVTTVYRP